MASPGGETNDQVSPRYGREGYRRLLQYRVNKLGPRLARTGIIVFFIP